FDIFPNPTASGEFTVSWADSPIKSHRIRVYNVEGKLVLDEPVLGGKYTGSLPSGEYVIVVEDESGVTSRKLVVI
ncbi:MAG: T9SS type A sorting domain-containing protein, partial [Flavobacteriales bacterium]|nr:T9SS type A sorting domain-containing protein [Flavobacteriales bacterium]